jgi:hypothetical protein
MPEFWKTIITTALTRILSWPVAFVVVVLIFRNKLSELLARLTRLTLKHGETAIEAETSGNAGVQAEKTDTPIAGLLSVSIGEDASSKSKSSSSTALTVQTNPEPADEAARQAAIDFGKNIVVVQLGEDAIKAHLARLHFDIGARETTEILIRNLAYTQALAAAERAYRLIFGSQISLLKSLNCRPASTDAEMQRFYEQAKRKFRKFYGHYTYVEWRDFLLDQGLIVHDADRDVYGITQAGRDFIVWIVSQGLSEDKFG